MHEAEQSARTARMWICYGGGRPIIGHPVYGSRTPIPARAARYGHVVSPRRYPVLLGVMLLPVARLITRPGPGYPSTASETRETLRFPLAQMALAVVCTIAILAGLGLFFVQYNETLPQIGEDPETGQILVFFDRPGVVATVEVRASAAFSGDVYAADDYEIDIQVTGIAEQQVPRYSVVLAGSALPLDDWPDGSKRASRDNTCLSSITGPGDLECLDTKGSPESLFASDESQEDLVVVSGRIQRFEGAADSGQGWVYVTARPASVSESGERRVFQLPTVGTGHFPESLRNELTAVVDGIELYATEATIIVKYDWLHPTDQLESVSIEPAGRQPLTWIETFQSTLTASGTIIDSREERAADRNVFFWGVLAGVLGGFLIPVGALWIGVARRWRAWLSGDHPSRLKTRRATP